MPDFVIQPRPATSRSTHWAEPKRCRSLNLTDTAWGILTDLADKLSINGSELIERVMRQEAVRDVDDLNRPRLQN